MKNIKKIFLLLIIGITILPISTSALITGNVYTDSVGRTNYIFSDGTSGNSYKDEVGYTHYQFNNGMYGGAYTDIVGNTHYYFDNQQNNQYVSGICRFPTGLFCTEESQYQNLYQKAAQGLTQAERDSGTFVFTPENSAYGSMLQMCREHIDIYKTAKATYDKCVQTENEKWQQRAKAQLDNIIQQANFLNQQRELEKLKAEVNKQTTPVKSTPVSNDVNICSSGLVWNGKACVTCAVYMPHSSPQIYGSVIACSCDNGFHYDLSSQSCLTATEWIKTEQKPKTPFQAVSVDLERKKVEAELKLEADKKAAENKAVKIAPIKNVQTVKNEVVKDLFPSTINNTTSSTQVENKTKEQVQNTVVEQPKKVGVFQGMSGFFRKIFIKIKFW